MKITLKFIVLMLILNSTGYADGEPGFERAHPSNEAVTESNLVAATIRQGLKRDDLFELWTIQKEFFASKGYKLLGADAEIYFSDPATVHNTVGNAKYLPRLIEAGSVHPTSGTYTIVDSFYRDNDDGSSTYCKVKVTLNSIKRKTLVFKIIDVSTKCETYHRQEGISSSAG